MKVVKQLVLKAGFSEEVVEVVANGIRKSTACLLGKVSSFLHWCYGPNIASCKATVPQLAESFPFLCRELKLTVPVINGAGPILISFLLWLVQIWQSTGLLASRRLPT